MRHCKLILSILIIILISGGFMGTALAAGSIAVMIEGKSLAFDQPPILVNNRVLVPMRAIFEELGAELSWDSDTQTVYAKKAKLKIILVIGSLQAIVNGKETALDVPALLINGSTMVPIRFVSEALGQAVSYNSTKKTIVIGSKATMEARIASLLEQLVVLPKTAYDKNEVEKMKARLARFGPAILQKLADSGDKIILVNGQITEVEAYKDLKDVVQRGWEDTGITWDDVPGIGGFPVVIRIGFSEPSAENGHSSINLELHETAHAIDTYVFDDISQTAEFKKVWKKEVFQLYGDDESLARGEALFYGWFS